MSSSRARRAVAFVCPRYGTEIVGGAEALVREIAQGLTGRGWEVEILTTCAVSPYTWANELPEGTDTDGTVRVRRFANILNVSESREHAVHGRIFHGEPTTLDDQLTWLGALFRTPGLFEVLLREADRFDAVVFAPYLFWTTTACMPAVADRAIVMPCLHDEVWARIEGMRHVLSLPASVWFLSGPEHDLAHRLGPVTPHHDVVGAGMDVPEAYEPDEFRSEYGIDGPFILYLGRREREKGWPWLMDVFARTKTPVRLVSAGAGHVDIPPTLRARVVDVGLLTVEQRNNALAAALAYVQPSLMESYSRTVMESWLAGRPVLVREGSAVVEWHRENSEGGWPFAGPRDLGRHLKELLSDGEVGHKMGARGRSYVLDNYQWPDVLQRMEDDIISISGC